MKKKETEQQLAINQKLLEEKEKELARLKFTQPTKPTKNDNNDSKVNLAIGLGIAAVVIGLLCLIALSNKRQKRY